MYSKDEVSRLKQEFWTAFGHYLALQQSSEGEKINWINYKTGIKYLHFKMEADAKSANIAIEMSHPDLAIQELLFEQFAQFRKLLHAQLNEEWVWELHTTDSFGKAVSRISTRLDGVSIFKKDDWAAIISFLKPRLIALDEFWNDAKYSFNLFA